MKRIASLFLAFVMICMVCAVSVPVYADDFDKAVGVWKLEEMSGDNTMSKEDLKEYERLGVAMYLKLRKDGTCKFSLYGDTMEGTWSEYGIVLDNAWFTYILDGDKLVLDNQDGSDMIFTRSSMDEIYKILGYQKGILDEDVHYSTKEKKILDTDTASVVITGYKADMTGFTVSMRCKNKTRNEITIGVDKCVLNKYIFHPEWSETLDRRETLETKMRIIPAEIAKTGISVVDEMILQMHLSNATNGRTIKKGIMATVYPTGRKADQVRTPLRKPVENEYRILVNNTCAYIIQGMADLGKIRTYRFHVESDELSITDNFVFGMITNSKSVGGFPDITGTKVDMSDGLFEVTLIKMPSNILELNDIVQYLSHAADASDLVFQFKTRHIVLESDEYVKWTRDGEYGGSCRKVELTNLHRALKILVPAE